MKIIELKIIDIDILSAFFYNESSKKEKEDFSPPPNKKT